MESGELFKEIFHKSLLRPFGRQKIVVKQYDRFFPLLHCSARVKITACHTADDRRTLRQNGSLCKKSSAIKSNATAIWIIRNRDMFSGHFISSTIFPVIFQITIAIVSDYFVIAPYS